MSLTSRVASLSAFSRAFSFSLLLPSQHHSLTKMSVSYDNSALYTTLPTLPKLAICGAQIYYVATGKNNATESTIVICRTEAANIRDEPSREHWILKVNKKLENRAANFTRLHLLLRNCTFARTCRTLQTLCFKVIINYKWI